MDPQKLASLDPKLRDAYQRVMGTTIPEPQTAPPAQMQAPPPPIEKPTTPTEPTVTPTSEPQPAPLTSQPIAEPQPAINPQPQSIPTPQSIPAQPTSNFVQMNSEVAATPTFNSPNFSAPASQTQTIALKKKNKMMPILFGIVGLIFIAVYTLFWTKIFNLKLPLKLPFLQ